MAPPCSLWLSENNCPAPKNHWLIAFRTRCELRGCSSISIRRYKIWNGNREVPLCPIPPTTITPRLVYQCALMSVLRAFVTNCIDSSRRWNSSLDMSPFGRPKEVAETRIANRLYLIWLLCSGIAKIMDRCYPGVQARNFDDLYSVSSTDTTARKVCSAL